MSPEVTRLDTARPHLQLLAKIAARVAQDNNPLLLIDWVFAHLAPHLALTSYLFYQADRPNRLQPDDPGLRPDVPKPPGLTLSLVSYQGIEESIAEQLDCLACEAATRESLTVWPAGSPLAKAPTRLPDLSGRLAMPVGAHLPLGSAGQLFGTLVFAGDRPPFTTEELELLQAVCDLLAAALERGRLRFQLQTEHARFEALLDHMPAAVLLAEAPSGRIVMGNPQAEKMLGQLETPGNENSPLLRALAGEKERDIDYLYRRRDGTQTWIRASGSPIRDGSGHVIGSLITCYDIDDRMQIEQELRQADRTKDQFLAMLGHELRNPLATITYALAVLETDGPPDDASREPLEIIGNQVKNITRIIEDLLDVSRIKQGKITIHKQPIDLRDVIRRGVDATRPLREDRQHSMAVSLPEEWLTVEADPTRMEQVVVNLLNNAAKYTEPGGRVWLSAQRVANDVCLKVRDSGIGMSPEMLASAFDLYSQDTAARQHAEGGLGIGLALVEGLVKLHGGTVTAESEGVGRGSQFIVRLPLAGQGVNIGTGFAMESGGFRGHEPGRPLLAGDRTL